MPLLTLEEIKGISPFFESKTGRWTARRLMRWLNIDRTNALYDRLSSEKGPAFASAVLHELGVKYELIHAERLDHLPDGPFIVIANHPYGSLDGIMMIEIFGRQRPDFKVMVNGFLSRIEPLSGNFINVTPIPEKPTAPTKDSIEGVRTAMDHVKRGHPLGIFPSGAVSDLSIKDGCIRDRQWQEPVIRLIKKLRVPIIPVHFLDGNSGFYYSLGLISWKVRLLRLPSELFNKRCKTARIMIGNPIAVSTQDEIKTTEEFGKCLRDSVYKMR